MSPSSAPEPPIDFVIITVIDEEFEAIRKQFRLVNSVSRNGRMYYWGRIPTHSLDSNTVVCVQSLSRGNIPAALVVSDTIRDWNPRYLLLVGICGGVAGRDSLALGDVVFSESIKYYEMEKESPRAVKIREVGSESPSPVLFEVARHIDPGWAQLIESEPPATPDRPPKASPGQILAGEVIWSNPRSRRLRKLLQSFDKALGVETEGEGVARSVYEARLHGLRPEFILIRGVSDIVNTLEDNQGTRDRWRVFASSAAAAFALGIVRQTQTALELKRSESDELTHRYFLTRVPFFDTGFYGRESEVEWLVNSLNSASKIAVVQGIGGRGKTRLACEFIHRYARERFPDGVVWVDCNDQTIPDDLLVLLKQHLRLSPQTSQEYVAGVLAEKSMLIVLDNAETLGLPEDRLAGWKTWVRNLDSDKGSRVLVLTRASLFDDLNPKRLNLVPLDSKAALAVLKEISSREGNWETIRPHSKDLISLTSAHPRLLELCVHWASQTSIETVLQELREMRGPDIEEFVTSTIHRIAEQVAARRGLDLLPTLSAMSAFRGGFTAAALQQVVGANPDRTVRELLNLGFVRFDQARERYQLDVLVQRAVPPDMSILSRHFAFFAELVGEGTRDERKHPTIEAELDNLRAAYWWGVENSPEKAVKLANGLQYFLRVRALWDLAEGIGQSALTASRSLGLPPLEADCLLNLGSVLRRQGKSGDAMSYCERALSIYDDIRDDFGEANALLRIGDIRRTMGQLDVSLSAFLKAKRAFESGGHDRELAHSNRRIADIWRLKGDFESAGELYSSARDVLAKLGDLRGMTTCDLGLADIAVANSELAKAESSLTSIIATCHHTEDTLNLSRALRRLAIIRNRSGDPDAAIRLYNRSIRVCERIRNAEGKAFALFELGQIQFKSAAAEGGERSMTAAAQLFAEVGLDSWSRRTLDCLVRLRDNPQLGCGEGLLEV